MGTKSAANVLTTNSTASNLAGSHLDCFKLDTSGRAADYEARNWWVCGKVRVALDGEDGVQVHVFTDSKRYVLSSSARFDGSAPAYAVLQYISAVS